MALYATASNIEVISAADNYLSLSGPSLSHGVRYDLSKINGVSTAALNADDLSNLYSLDCVSIGRDEKAEFEMYLAQRAEEH
jgi:hypothetical protein